MRIALAHDWLLQQRGGEKILSEFCLRWKNLSIYTLFLNPQRIHPVIKQHAIYVSRLGRLPAVERYYRYLLPWFPYGIEEFYLRDFDQLFSISHAVAKGIPHDPGIPHICYSLTPMRYLWFDSKMYFPGQQWSMRRTLLKLFSKRLKTWDLQSNNRVNHFVAISQTVRQRIEAVYGRAAHVIYPPVDLEFFQPGGVPRENFYLIISSLVPYKRIDVAIDAFNQNGKMLLIAGEGPLHNRLRRRARSNIRFLGWVSKEEVRRLYWSAKALVFPGVEDFGLVPVEAQACGCPVIGYGEGGVTETVIEGETGVLFREPAPEALIRAIERFEKIPWDEERTARNAARFSRERFHLEWETYLRTLGIKMNGADTGEIRNLPIGRGVLGAE